MYLFKIIAKDSPIEGKGVFACEPILKNSIVWKYEPAHDKSITQEAFLELNDNEKVELEKIGYISQTSGMWIFPPHDDPARYTNHDPLGNNLTAEVDLAISPEPFFRANRDIEEGEELTNNYLEFDDFTQKSRPEWV